MLSFASILLVFLSANLSQDSNHFEPSIDTTFGDASDEFMEAESAPPVVEEGIL